MTSTKSKDTQYNEMAGSFKGLGMNILMNSAYAGGIIIMFQIGREEWKINMVGMCQRNRTGAGKTGAKEAQVVLEVVT